MGEHSGLSLAVQYRPRSFDDVVGQGHVTTVLRKSIGRGKLPQQLLFSGGSGLGKTTLARIAAAALLCEAPGSSRNDSDVCGSCTSCLDALDPTRVHPDVIEFDAASHGGKDEVRDIASRAHVAPLRGAWKVYIIDEAHGLSGPGGQAFLKILEEPPAHVVFMMCTTDPQKMLKTNRGRCVEFELLPPSHEALLENLERICRGQKWDVPQDVLSTIVASSDPDLGVRGTVSTLARVGTLYEDGGDPSDALVASVLGTAPPAGVRRLCRAIEACDRRAALSELSSLRTVSSDSAVRSALRVWANERVRASLGGSDAALSAALWSLEQVLNAPPAREWLDVVVARLASPEVDGPLVATEESARALAGELRQLIEEARSIRVPVAAERPASGAVMSGTVAQVLAAAAPAPPGLAEVLALCEVTLTDEHLSIVVPTEYTARVGPFNAALKTSASRLGVSLKLRRRTS